MELFAAAALLWRHRLLVVTGLVLAIAAGWKLTSGPTTSFGAASAQVVLDTPTSQLADVQPVGGDTLPGRAFVLADLAATNDLSAKIAQRAHVNPKDLAIKAAYRAAPPKPTVLPTRALEVAWADPAKYVLAIQGVDDLPLIGIDASAPTAKDAVRLTAAAVEVLKSEPSAYSGVPDTQPFTVDAIGPIHSRTQVNGPRRAVGAAAALFTFVLWCFGVMVLASIVRAIRVPRSPARAVG